MLNLVSLQCFCFIKPHLSTKITNYIIILVGKHKFNVCDKIFKKYTLDKLPRVIAPKIPPTPMYFEGQKQCFVLYQIYKKHNKNKLNFLVQEEDLGGLILINSKKGHM